MDALDALEEFKSDIKGIEDAKLRHWKDLMDFTQFISRACGGYDRVDAAICAELEQKRQAYFSDLVFKVPYSK